MEGTIIDDLLTAVAMGPEWMTPSQWRDEHHRHDPYQSERRLILAAFRSHLEDYRNPKRPKYRLEVTEWLVDDSEAVLSFKWYCDVLRLSPSAVRARILAGAVTRIKVENSRHRGARIRRTG
jgi:hypothetical protein